MNIDRELQRYILEILATSYPRPNGKYFINELRGDFPDEPANYTQEQLNANLAYLQEHHFIKDFEILELMDDIEYDYDNICLTAEGVDFLLDDGGITAIKNVVSVHFHKDTEQLIINAINHSELTPARKQQFLDELARLPSEGIKHLLIQLLDKGVALLGLGE